MAEQKKIIDPLKSIKTKPTKMIKNIFDDLIEQDVINPNQIRDMKKDFLIVKDRSENLIKTVTHKSSQISQIVVKRFLTASQQLHSAIQGEDENSEEIENAGMSQTVASILAPRAIQAAEPLNKVKLSPPDFYEELKEAKNEEIYAIMEKKTRMRLALIICNTKYDHPNEQNKAKFDIQRMKELLQDLDYRVDIKENLTSLEMKSVLEKFADRPEHQSSDSTFLVFMSCGTSNGIIGIDHKQEDPDILANDTIFEIFNNSNCSTLRHKPKVIIIHAWQLDDIFLEDDQVGSLFISLLIDCFQQFSWCCHVEEVFRKVQKSFSTSSNPAPMPTIERQSMTRYFYLFPGI
ncbi:caspase-12-like isoform X2 [Antechinus flavipes]|uniref:caspase-12-like isoform X2 n=1 Tax=Antechinus flavipes TaxID=38775 RepID=UPI0022366A5D|nr:caspase-12-like isoform X2 [Antechinus flavipes]